MKRAIFISLLVGSAAAPNFAADGELPALRRRTYRSLDSAQGSIPTAAPKVEAVYKRTVAKDIISKVGSAKHLRSFSPFANGETAIVDPPIPEQGKEVVIAEKPLLKAESSDLAGKSRLSPLEADSAKAIGIAQTYYRRGLWESSAEWYQRALDMDPDSVLAAEGFVMSAFHAGEYNYAYRVSNEMSGTTADMKDKVIEAASQEINLLLKNNRLEEAGKILNHFPLDEPGLEKSREKLLLLQIQQTVPKGTAIIGATDFIEQFSGPAVKINVVGLDPIQNAFMKAAKEDYRTGKYTSSLWDLEQAEKEGPLPAEGELLRGWNLYRTGQLREAANLFEELYKTQTDIGSARGVVVSLRKLEDHERLGQLVAKWGGILAGESKAVETTAFDFIDTSEVLDE